MDEASQLALVRAVIEDSRYAVLATASDEQPHASLMAFASLDTTLTLVFATYRGTRKFRNLVANPRVALLIDHRETARLDARQPCTLTAVGRAREIVDDAPRAAAVLRERHPDLADFLESPDCVLMSLGVEWYQLVGGIDDVGWCRAADVARTPRPGEPSPGQPD